MKLTEDELERIRRTEIITQEDLRRSPTLHFCHEWDFLVIDDTCPEWECCRCRPRGNNDGNN